MPKPLKPIKIKVLQKHIDSGDAGNPHCCPIALALRAKTRKEWSVTSGHAWLAVTNGMSKLVLYTIPDSARKFISDFDHHRPVEPAEFELVPTQSTVQDALARDLHVG
jgi:hypothetical protein